VRHRVVPTTVVDGIRVVTVEQAIADVAGGGDPAVLASVVEHALWRDLVDLESLVGLRARMSAERAKGVRLLAAVLDEQATGVLPPTSELERALYTVLDDRRLPAYVRQAPFPWWPWAPHRVDAYVPAWHRIIEADGRRWHTRRADFERDRWRDHLAQAHGIEVTRFTHRQLVRDPGYARTLLKEIAAHRAAA
jgi:very-short-patch-repair endonuclease